MTESFEAQRDRAFTAGADPAAIEKGWSVYDSLGRPLGNVTDVEGGQLRIDGRPEGLGFLEVPFSSVRGAAEGDVHLSVRMEEVTGRAAGASASSAPVDIRATPGQSSTTYTTRANAGDTTGSSYTASGTPLGLGSNTPVGDEPSSFRAWEQDTIDRGSPWSRLGAWIAAGLVGAVGIGAYLWWRREQARRTPLGRMRYALQAASESVEPVWGAARERQGAWWLAPLAALPLILYLRSKGDEEETSAETSREAGSYPWERLLGARDYAADQSDGPGRSLSGRWSRPLDKAREMSGYEEDNWQLWMVGVPAVAAAVGAAWYASRGRRSGRATRRLGEIMTPGVQVIRPEGTVFEAASMMKRLDVGSLPVCDGRRIRGMLTDRDIVVRAVADGRDLHLSRVQDIMSDRLVYAFADDSIEKGAGLMRKHQIRRLPIVDKDRNLVGIVSLGDLAVDAGDDRMSGETLEQVSEPSH